MRLFKAKAEPDADGFFETISQAALPAEEMVSVIINGQKLIIVQWQEQLFAFKAECPHAAADLAEGWISRYKVTCPDHEYCFDMRDGRILWPEDEFYRLKKYPAKDVDGIIKVKL